MGIDPSIKLSSDQFAEVIATKDRNGIPTIEELRENGKKLGYDDETIDSILKPRTMSQFLLEQQERINKDKNVLTEKEFEKFIPLYQQRSNDLNPYGEEYHWYRNLSNEFISRIDPYEAIIVKNPTGGEDMVLPPVLRRINTLQNEDALVVTELSERLTSGRPDYEASAMSNFCNTLEKSQKFTPEQVIEERKKILAAEQKALRLVKGIPDIEEQKEEVVAEQEESLASFLFEKK